MNVFLFQTRTSPSGGGGIASGEDLNLATESVQPTSTSCPHKKGATDFFTRTFTNMHGFL